MTIQHLRSSTANKRPTPAAMSDGQLAVNTNTASPGLFFKDSAGALIKVGPVHVGTTAPNASPAGGGEAGNTVGEQWLDTTGGTYVFKTWDGSAWRSENGTFVDVNGDVMTGALGIIAGTAGTPGLYFSGDTNTGLYSPGADQVAISTGGSGRLFIDSSGNVGIGTTSPGAVLHAVSSDNVATQLLGGATSDLRVFSHLTSTGGSFIEALNSGLSAYQPLGINGSHIGLYTGGSERARIDSSGRLLVGTSMSTTGVAFPSQIQSNAFYAYSASLFSADNTGSHTWFLKSRNATVNQHTAVQSGDVLGRINFAGSDGDEFIHAALIQAVVDNGAVGTAVSNNECPAALVFSTTADGASSPTERMRITNGGDTYFGQSTTPDPAGTDVNGTVIGAVGYISITRTSAAALSVNRKTDDGELVRFNQAGTLEGTITVAGTTVSYNGAHLSRWSQLPIGEERTEILRGTVLSNIDEMCEWSDEDNEQLNRMKVSNVEGDKNVSGVFQGWDDDDDTYTDDFYCAMTGDFIIRIGAGVTVERGDLLMSAGDGTAKPQDDDTIRSKTIAKVTSTNVTCTYDDGSYCVPCVLMAC